jgi:nicotinamide-nucleotide amidase
VLGGRVAERNAAFLARALGRRGVRVERTLVVGDDPDEVREAVAALLARGPDLLCTTGGLGPTDDDLTMRAVAEAVGRPMRLDESALAMVVERSRAVVRRRRVDPLVLERIRRKQATLPDGATVLPPEGTAPGAALTHDGTVIVVLPGPPWELQSMWAAAVEADPLRGLFARGGAPPSRTLRLWSVVEAELVEVLDRLSAPDRASLGTYTKGGELEVVVPEHLAPHVTELIAGAFGDALFATDERTVDTIVAARLAGGGETLAVGESCTGGGLGARLTEMAGASTWFVGGVIAYADRVKERLLGVDPAIIAQHGAVSEQCARAMAAGARAATGADWGVAITGIAGPGGGTAEKPVGLVWIAIAGPGGGLAVEHRFWRGDRAGVRARSETAALHHLREALARDARTVTDP